MLWHRRKIEVTDGAPKPRLTRLRRILESPLASRTAVATGFQLLRLVFQVAFLIALARALEPATYGVFVGAAGLASAAAGLSGLGTGMLMVKQVAVQRKLWSATWTHALRMFVSTGAVLSAGFVACAPSLLHISLPLSALACIGLSELICLPLVYLGGFAFQAFDRIAWSAALPCVMAACRLVGVTAFISLQTTRTLPAYLVYHATASLVAVALMLILVSTMLRPGRSSTGVPKGTTAEALRFCAGWFTNNALIEMDKSLAVRFGSPATAAAYALAYRLSSSLSTPTTSLVLSAQPRLFSMEGEQRRKLTMSIILTAAVCSSIACVAMILLAPALPWVFGPAYEQAGTFAGLLALLPLAFGLRFVLGSLLVAEGRPGLRATLEAVGGLIMIASASILIPRFGAHGMAGMIMVSETSVAIAAAISLTLVRRRRLTDFSGPQA
jgi:O-antigen/teichoic acid export membrane protein